MIIRKKKLQELISAAKNSGLATNYNNWENDFGFLTLVLNRKIQISKQFFITPMSEQVENEKDYIHDTDIEKEYPNIVSDIYNMLSDNYKNFLIVKYFKDESELITFISETVYAELSNFALEKNKKKITREYSKAMINSLSKLNKKE